MQTSENKRQNKTFKIHLKNAWEQKISDALAH